ncbi:hypothetical protein GCM10010977_17190 [Citricoccus zhacaiensis]|uniref:Uncharacterized protein n=1 Tax=Citricoccus zhacaiensis TaxID=489142 RepID=A0ABQ2LZP4_9MICC|nr:hypothetical protein GCM10010977_17190 [Citricoccus zhacaiensis]
MRCFITSSGLSPRFPVRDAEYWASPPSGDGEEADWWNDSLNDTLPFCLPPATARLWGATLRGEDEYFSLPRSSAPAVGRGTGTASRT